MSNKEHVPSFGKPNAHPGKNVVTVLVRHEVVKVPVHYVSLPAEPMLRAPVPIVASSSEVVRVPVHYVSLPAEPMLTAPAPYSIATPTPITMSVLAERIRRYHSREDKTFYTCSDGHSEQWFVTCNRTGDVPFEFHSRQMLIEHARLIGVLGKFEDVQ